MSFRDVVQSDPLGLVIFGEMAYFLLVILLNISSLWKEVGIFYLEPPLY